MTLPHAFAVRASLVASITLAATAALADIEVRFVEGAPKDRFEIRNAGSCPLEDVEVTIDLTGSVGALVFDVTGEGAGVEVFQPFEVVEGADALAALPDIADGDTKVALSVARLGPDATVAFTTDVDDTIAAREITVTDGEIADASVRVTMSGTAASGTFAGSNTARVVLDSCAG